MPNNADDAVEGLHVRLGYVRANLVAAELMVARLTAANRQLEAEADYRNRGDKVGSVHSAQARVLRDVAHLLDDLSTDERE